MPYNFKAGGAYNAIVQQLAQRAAAERQAMLDKFNMEQQREDLKLRREQEARIADAQQAAAEDLKYNRRGVRAGNVHENALPGVISQGAADEANEFGFGGDITKSPVAQGAPTGQMLEGAEDVPLYAVTGGETTHKGGSKYQAAKQVSKDKAEAATFADANRADIAAQNRDAQRERTDADRASREQIAGMNASGRSDTTDLRNQIAQLDIDKKTQEATDAKDTREAKAKAVIQPAQDASDVIDDIMSSSGELKPGVADVVGLPSLMGAVASATPFAPGSNPATAIVNIDRLKALLTLETLGRMKAQSRSGASGFGALSGPELKILQDAAARLSRVQSEASFKTELSRVRAVLHKALAGAGDGDAAAPKAASPMDSLYDAYLKKQ